jgi:lipoprotein-anchoring transpeptidase ErfK/SrfK
VVLTPPIEGRGLDIDAAVQMLIGAVAPDGPTTLTLPVSEHIQPRLNADVLEGARLQAEALLATPVILRGDDLDLTYDAATIGSWLTVQHNTGTDTPPIVIGIDQARIRALIAPLAPRVRRDTSNAAYEYDQARRTFVVTDSALEGRQLDVDRTVAAVVAALGGSEGRVVAPVADRWAPGLSNSDIAAASRQATQSYLAGPLIFSWGGQRWLLTVPELAQWIKILPGQTATAGPRVVFDETALADYIAGLKGQITVPAIDATYTMDNGSDVFRLTGASQVGRTLDDAATRKAALAALAGGPQNRVLALSVSEVRPQVTEADVAALVPERWIDVDLTAQRMYAVVGKKVVYTAVISSGKKGWETPTGTYHILYRVENETMTSESIGAEDYYRLENVLYTQYFTYEGHALHYSWWKTPESFGTPSSHGCVSETLADSEFFWNFAEVGTRVTIRGVSPT